MPCIVYCIHWASGKQMSRQEKWIRRTLEKDKVEKTQEEVGKSVNLSAGLASMKVKEKEGVLERRNLKWQCSSESQGQQLGAPERILPRAERPLSLPTVVLSPWRNPAQESVMSACRLQQIPKVQGLGAPPKFSLQPQVLSWREIQVHTPMAVTRTGQNVPKVALERII